MTYHLNVVNIKSSGCVNTICATLNNIDGVDRTIVNVTNGVVIVDAINGMHDTLASTLFYLGYPEAKRSRQTSTFSVIEESLLTV